MTKKHWESVEEAQVYPVCNFCLMPVVAREWDDHLRTYHPHTRQARELDAYEPDWYTILRLQHRYRKPQESSLLKDWLTMKLKGLSGEEARLENERLIREWEEHVLTKHSPPISAEEETVDHV